MYRSTLWPLLGRITAVIAVLALLGILIRLIGAVLVPVLPPSLTQAISAGWQQLYSVVGPAIPAIMALLVLGALIYIAIGRR